MLRVHPPNWRRVLNQNNSKRFGYYAERLFSRGRHPGFLRRAGRAMFRWVAPRQGTGPHVLLAPPGGGNIGDQAMINAYLENVAGPVVMVVRRGDAAVQQPIAGERVDCIELEHLVYGGGLMHLRDVVRFAQVLRGARSLSIIGADIMDGAYNAMASVHRANLASWSAAAGIDTRVLGFSWNGAPHPLASVALREASRNGVRLFLRDPISASRAREAGLENVQDVMDTVFAASRQEEGETLRRIQAFAQGGAYALVNASALVAAGVDQCDEYEAVVRTLLDRGLRVVLLPHVSRPSGDDKRELEALHARVTDPGVMRVNELLTPEQVRCIAQHARLVITGRMHLAILSLSGGTPAITLATQGKVEGLMQMFGTEELCIAPKAGFGARVVSLVRKLLDDQGRTEQQIVSRLPHVSLLSRRNYVGL